MLFRALFFPSETLVDTSFLIKLNECKLVKLYFKTEEAGCLSYIDVGSGTKSWMEVGAHVPFDKVGDFHLLSTSHNFLFIHIPKTGGNAIQKVLLPYSDDEMVLTNALHDGIDRFEIRSANILIHKHSSLEEYRRQLDQQVFDKLIKVACIRNPWDRCVSFFFSPHRGPVQWSEMAFSEFIESTVKPHSHFLKTSNGGSNYFDNIDYYLRFERIGEDFERLCNRLHIDGPRLPHINKSTREPYQYYYKNHKTIDLVAKTFSDEIEQFQYAF